MDSVSEARLGVVHPLLTAKVRMMADILEPEAIIFRVTQGLRTWAEQAALYAQGRTAPGKIVTNAAPGASYHNYGLAVDVVPMTIEGPDWNEQHPVWSRLVSVGTSLGLVAGAQFRSFPDQPHFQLTGSLPVSPDEHVRELFSIGGITSVWRMAFPDDMVVPA